MKLLLVDDERYVIESIKKNICWERTGITEIYTAFTMKQAQEIITAVKMDIIISDIVMPAAMGEGAEFQDTGYFSDQLCGI